MELLSRQQREGQPVACAYGCQVTPDGLRAGLLFVREQVTGPVTLCDPTGRTACTVHLPADFEGQDEPLYGVNEHLESA